MNTSAQEIYHRSGTTAAGHCKHTFVHIRDCHIPGQTQHGAPYRGYTDFACQRCSLALRSYHPVSGSPPLEPERITINPASLSHNQQIRMGLVPQPKRKVGAKHYE